MGRAGGWTGRRWHQLSGLALPLRYAVLAGAAAGVVGGVVGLVVGLVAHPPTAWFAVLELGVPATYLGSVLGLLVGSLVILARRHHPWRTAVGRSLGVLGLAGYNWWVVVAWDRRLLRTPDELFSDLEAIGQPYARLLSDLDVVSGALILLAILLIGRPAGRRRREWWLLVVFACAGILGGLFPYVCAEGLSATCRSAEWSFGLPWQHYMHVVAGLVEFATATAAALLAWRRTQEQPGIGPRIVRTVVAVLAVGYPLLAVTYLTGRLGAFVEPLFFVAFSALVAVELAEPR